MNKAYRVIWSGVRNCYVVTSELAKKHKKSTANGMLNAVVSAGLIIAAGGQVLAAPSELVPGEGPGIAVGNESKATSESAIALGANASAEDENVIAMGPGAVARAKGSLAIGLEAETGKATLSGQSAEDSIAIGTRATTFGMESIAIGKESHSDGQAVVIGSEAKSNTTDPKAAVVIGHKASTKNGNTVAIGGEAKAEANNGIAIGTQSLVRGHGGLAIGGTGSLLRPIDAPHVSDILPGAVALGQTSMALGPQAMSSGESSIALGLVSHAAGENALAIGELTYAGTLAHAAGYKARAIGTATQAQGMYSVATGAGGLAFGPYAVSVGSPSFKQGKPTSDAGYGIAIGGESFSSGYSAALGFKAQANGRGSLALGVGATVELEDIQAITDKNVEGYLAGNQDIKDLIESRYASELKKFQADDRHKNKALAGFVREYLYAQKAETMGNMKGTAIGYMTTVSAPMGVALGAHSIGDRAEFTAKTIAPFSEVDLNGKTLGAVSVGQKDGLRQIIHVADGTQDTDAVNLRQLKGLEKKLGGAKTDTDIFTTGGRYNKDTKKIIFNRNDNKTYEVDLSDLSDGIVAAVDGVKSGEITDSGKIKLYTDDKKTKVVELEGTLKDASVKAGTYAVGKENTVVLDMKDNYSGKDLTERVTIKDVAKASDVGNIYQFHKNVLNADGSKTTVVDAINNIDTRVTNIRKDVNVLGDRLDGVGAGAAALAALHPLDFDPDDKWDFAASYGRYHSRNAYALGAYYRPNEDTMFSIGGTVGSDEDMLNAGISVKLGQGNHVSTSKVAMAREIKELRAIVEKQNGQIQKLEELVLGHSTSGLQENTRGEFPDLPKNHWAYEYVRALADRGLIAGYPDGEFKGDRSMTRYEFAAIIYRALQNGAVVDGHMTRAVSEFAPELEKVKLAEYFRIDTVMTDGKGNPKIQRVRVSVNN